MNICFSGQNYKACCIGIGIYILDASFRLCTVCGFFNFKLDFSFEVLIIALEVIKI
jgi:hypothetical protein